MNPQKPSAPRMREKPTLPTDFASTLLAAEFELEKHCTVENVSALVAMYQQAIEFYEHMKDSRFVDFQARMHKMFVRADVQAQLNPSATSSESSTKQRGPKLRREVSLRTEPPIKQTRRLEHLFEHHKKVSSSSSINAKQDVADQHSNLNQRLAQRKLNKSALDMSSMKGAKQNSTFDCEQGSETSEAETASFSFLEEMRQEELREEERRKRGGRSLNIGDASPPPAVTSECDRSGGFPLMSPPRHIDELAKQLEDAMERIYSERAMKESEIKVKYETQIAELQREMNGSDFMRKIVENMKAEMQKEMEKLWKEMETRRKKEIKDITEEYTG